MPSYIIMSNPRYHACGVCSEGVNRGICPWGNSRVKGMARLVEDQTECGSLSLALFDPSKKKPCYDRHKNKCYYIVHLIEVLSTNAFIYPGINFKSFMSD